MAATTQIQVIISAQDNATKIINGVGSSMDGLSKQSESVKHGADIVSEAFLGVVAAGVAVTGVSIKMASDFQSTMLLIQTQAGGSAAEVKKMTQAVLELAPAVGQSPKNLAQGLFFIESAGYSGAKALDILKLSAEGAAIGHDSLIDVSKALTSVLNSQIKGVNGASQAMGVMDAIVGHGKMTMTDLTGAISTGVLPAAKQAGVSLQQLGAALDVMTNNGIPATDAATRLRMTITLMADPTSKATSELQKVGLTQRSLADDMQKGGLIAAITDLNNHMNATQQGTTTIVKGTKETGAQLLQLGNNILDTTARLKILNETHVKAGVATDSHNLAIQRAQQELDKYKGKLGDANSVINTLGGSTLDAVGKAQLLTSAFGGARSGSTIELLTQQTNSLSKSLTGINATSGEFAKSWQATQATSAQATARFMASVQVLSIELGTALLPAFTAIVNVLANNLIPTVMNTISFFEHHRLALVALATLLGGVMVVATIAFAMSLGVMTYSAAAGFALATPPAIAFGIAVIAAFWPIILIGALVIGAIVLIILYWKQISTVASTVAKAVLGFLNQMWAGIKAVFTVIQKVFSDFITYLVTAFLAQFYVPFWLIREFLIILWDFIMVGWAGIKLALTDFTNWLSKLFAPQIHATFTVIQTIQKALADFFTASWNFITGLLTDFGNWINKTFSPIIDATFKFITDGLTKLSDTWQKIWGGIKSFVGGIAQDIIGFVKNMINSIIGFFNNLISGANKVGSKVPGYVSIPSIPTFQTGGIVPGQIGSPTLILAHGGETVSPLGTSRGDSGGDGGGSLTIQVNVGLYAGSDTEKRNIAKQLYAALLQLAQSQHKTVASYMGG